jgi:predicted AAA+ superfamily ATPase
MFHRPIYPTLLARLREPRRFLQVLAGPRQVGKTTLARQVMAALEMPSHYASADAPTLEDRPWIEAQWEIGRLAVKRSQGGGAVLILDEIQKVGGWSEIVKRLWDEDTHAGLPLRVMVLGSSPLLVERGLSESLAGRFEMVRVPHWSLPEMRDAFGWGVEDFLYFGGYPGAAPLKDQPERWARYVVDSLIETTLARDILLMTRVDKPALLRRLFQLACAYSGQILSFQKMLGQLQDAGNTTTLSHYLDLLSGAGLVTGLQKFAGEQVRRRSSSPKLQVLNTALVTASSGLTPEAAEADRGFWGRLVESAVGAHLVNTSRGTPIEVFYWRERGHEVDFVLRRGRSLTALEVKSSAARGRLSGLEAFDRAFRPQKKLLVGSTGLPLKTFLSLPAAEWV